MVNAMVLLDLNGPLPLQATFSAPSDGPVMFVLTATAWTQTAGSLLMVNLSLDDTQIGNVAMCYANQAAVHQTLRTTYIPFDNLTAGEHSIYLDVGAETITDKNDYFQVTLFY
jgi:hypothetical protein